MTRVDPRQEDLVAPRSKRAATGQAPTAYSLRYANPTMADGDLHLTIWEMSLVRDAMIMLGAAHTAFPSIPSPSRTARCPSGLTGMPAYKLAAPDGWLVRSDEISESLKVLDATNQPRDELWRCWVKFLRQAIRLGGFIVD